MKSNRAIHCAARLLALRRRIVTDHLQHRNTSAVEFVQAREQVSAHRLSAARNRFAVIELLARVQQLRPAPAPDPVRRIEQREQRLLAKMSADANMRTAMAKRLRDQAAQAALDRAAFVEQVRRDVPEELQEETIQAYDRQLFEVGGDGGS